MFMILKLEAIMMFMWLAFLDLGRLLPETTSRKPINGLCFAIGASCVPPPPSLLLMKYPNTGG